MKFFKCDEVKVSVFVLCLWFFMVEVYNDFEWEGVVFGCVVLWDYFFWSWGEIVNIFVRWGFFCLVSWCWWFNYFFYFWCNWVVFFYICVVEDVVNFCEWWISYEGYWCLWDLGIWNLRIMFFVVIFWNLIS